MVTILDEVNGTWHKRSLDTAIKESVSSTVTVCEKKQGSPSYTVGGNVNWSSHYGEQYGGSLKNRNRKKKKKQK